MKRLPLVPTLMVALMLPVLIALGIWQLGRAEEKDALKAALVANAGAPVAALPAEIPGDFLFRRVTAVCGALAGPPRLAGGQGPDGRSGYRQLYRCERGAGETLYIDAGWTPAVERAQAVPAQRRFIGMLVPAPGLSIDGPAAASPPRFTLIAANAVAGLEPSTPPRVEDIPDNHMAYAVQWFFFAGTLVIIYVLFVRRRVRERAVAGGAPNP